MTEQTEAAEVEVARAAATLYDEVRAAVIAVMLYLTNPS